MSIHQQLLVRLIEANSSTSRVGHDPSSGSALLATPVIWAATAGLRSDTFGYRTLGFHVNYVWEMEIGDTLDHV